MLEQHARVVHRSEPGVWVEAAEPPGCGVCEGGGCASRRLAELFQRTPRQYRIDSRLDLVPGDRVVIGIPEGSVLRSALYVYGLPLIFIFAGALLLGGWFPGDAGAAAGAIVGMVLASVIITVAGRRHRIRASVIRRA